MVALPYNSSINKYINTYQLKKTVVFTYFVFSNTARHNITETININKRQKNQYHRKVFQRMELFGILKARKKNKLIKHLDILKIEDSCENKTILKHPSQEVKTPLSEEDDSLLL